MFATPVVVFGVRANGFAELAKMLDDLDDWQEARKSIGAKAATHRP